jgi:hypothetical protein
LLDKMGKLKKKIGEPKAAALEDAPEKASKKKKASQVPLAASNSRRVPPIRAAKQPITAIAREAVLEV